MLASYQGKKGKALYLNHPFEKGMVTTDVALQDGAVKILSNADITDSGSSAPVRSSFVNGLLKYPTADTKRLSDITIEHITSTSDRNYITADSKVDYDNFINQEVGDPVSAINLDRKDTYGLGLFSMAKGVNDRIGQNTNRLTFAPADITVHDGDTLHIDTVDNMGTAITLSIRLLGIDTPELSPNDDGKAYNDSGETTPWGTDARAFVEALVLDVDLETVEIEIDPRSDGLDAYERTLGWVWLKYTQASGKSDVLLQEQITLNGHGEVAYIDAHYKHLQQVFDAQQTAIAGNTGIWSIAGITPEYLTIPVEQVSYENDDDWNNSFYYTELNEEAIDFDISQIETPGSGDYVVQFLETSAYEERTYFASSDKYIQSVNLTHMNGVAFIGRIIYHETNTYTLKYKGVIILQFRADTGRYDIIIPKGSEVNMNFALEDGFNLIDDDPFIFRDYYAGDPDISHYVVPTALGGMAYNQKIQTNVTTGEVTSTGNIEVYQSLPISQTVYLKFFNACPLIEASNPAKVYMQKLEYKRPNDDEWQVYYDWMKFANSDGVMDDVDNSCLQFPTGVVQGARTVSFKYTVKVTSSYTDADNYVLDDATETYVVTPPMSLESKDSQNLFVDPKDTMKSIRIDNATHIASYYRHLILYGSGIGANVIQFTAFDDYTYYPYPQYNKSIPDKVISVVPAKGGIYVFTPSNIYLLYGSSDPKDMQLIPIYSNMALSDVDKRTIVPLDDGIFFMSNNKGYMLRPSRYVSDPSQVYVAPLTQGINDLLFDPRELIVQKMDYIYELTNTFNNPYELELNTQVKASNKNVYIFNSFEVKETLNQGTEEEYIKRSNIMMIHQFNIDSQRWTSFDSIAGTHPMFINLFGGLDNAFMLLRNDRLYPEITIAGTKVKINTTAEVDIADIKPFNLEGNDLTRVSQPGYKHNTILPVWFYMNSGKLAIAKGWEFNKKHFIELQMEFNNIENAELPVYFEFLIDGLVAQTFRTSEIVQDTDPGSPTYGLIYEKVSLSPTKVMQKSAITRLGSWVLEESRFPISNTAKLKLKCRGMGREPSFSIAIPSHYRFIVSSYALVLKKGKAK